MKKWKIMYWLVLVLGLGACHKGEDANGEPVPELEYYTYLGINIRFYDGYEYFNREPEMYPLDSVFFFNENGEQQAVDLVEDDLNGDYFHSLSFYDHEQDEDSAFVAVRKNYRVEFRPTDVDYPIISSPIQIYTKFKKVGNYEKHHQVIIDTIFLVFDKKDTINHGPFYDMAFEVRL